MIGKTVSHYRILAKLGAGGMGIVYKAHDLKLDRFVALKFLPSNLIADEEQHKRFIQEARAASAMDHPNIGAVYEIGETSDGQQFIVMAFYEGPSLASMLSEGPLDLDKVLTIASQIARGLTEAHRHGIIHRDLKPHNILTTTDGTPKIIDFGLAKIAAVQTQLTRQGSTVGTIAYMSPEQARGDEVTPQTDIWSLGVILYEMVTGRRPFRGEYEPAVVYSILNESPQPPSAFRENLPPGIDQVISAALEKEISLRYQSADELLADLEYLKGGASATPPEGSRITKGSRKSRSEHVSLSVPRYALAAVGLLIVIAAAIYLVPGILGHSIPVEERSIVVLPFTLEGDREHEYLVAGLGREVFRGLSTVPSLAVISQTTALIYANSPLSDQVIGDELGTRFVLRGSVKLQGVRADLRYHVFDAKNNDIVVAEQKVLDHDNLFSEVAICVNRVAEWFDVKITGVKIFGGTTLKAYDPYQRGIYHAEKNTRTDNALSMEYFRESIQRDSLYLPARLEFATALLTAYEQGWDQRTSMLDSAEGELNMVLSRDSQYAYAYVGLGTLAHLRHKNEARFTYLERALDLDKSNPVALTRLATIYAFEMNKPASAVVYIKRLQESDPTNWLTNSNVGVFYGQLKDYPRAIEAFRRSIQYNNQNEFAWINLGYAYERLEIFDSAMTHYQEAIKRNPLSILAYENLIWILNAMGRYEEALEALATGSVYHQNDAAYFYLFGATMSSAGKGGESRRAFREGLRLADDRIRKNPGLSKTHALAGLFHARLGNVSKAVAEASAALQADSNDADILMFAARTYAILGKKNEVLKWFAQARSKNPEFDAAFLSTALDLEKYRKDPDLLTICRTD